MSRQIAAPFRASGETRHPLMNAADLGLLVMGLTLSPFVARTHALAVDRAKLRHLLRVLGGSLVAGCLLGVLAVGLTSGSSGTSGACANLPDHLVPCRRMGADGPQDNVVQLCLHGIPDAAGFSLQ